MTLYIMSTENDELYKKVENEIRKCPIYQKIVKRIYLKLLKRKYKDKFGVNFKVTMIDEIEGGGSKL